MNKLLILGLACLFCGCRQDMHDQPKYKPYSESSFFQDGRSERPLVAGTVARGELRTDKEFYFGKDKQGNDTDEFPFPITREVMLRGRERYEIFCLPCHGYLGDGQGMIVKRGLIAPPTYHSDRLRNAPAGHFFDVITNGYGAMYSYSSRIPVEDRWAIVAYIRALQLSQNASESDLSAGQRAFLSGGPSQ